MPFQYQYFQGAHETEYLKYFGPDKIRAEKCLAKEKLPMGIFLCFTNRSGSNLIADCISNHPDIGLAGEVFNHPIVINTSQKKGFTTFEEYVHYLVETDTVNGRFICKVSAKQLFFLLKSGIVQDYFADSRYIVSTRKSLIKQAVSHMIARQDKQWSSLLEAKQKDVEYDRDFIYRSIQAIARAEMDLRVFFGLAGIEAYYITYEDFVADLVGETQKIGKFLGLRDVETLYAELKVRYEKQDSPQKEAFYNQFTSVDLMEALKEQGLIKAPDKLSFP